MKILEKLNSGILHSKARLDRPDCVDAKGAIHYSPERAEFVNWRSEMVGIHGDVSNWNADMKKEYSAKYVGAAR